MRFTSCPHDIEKRAVAELGSNQNLRPPVGMNIIESSLIEDADDRNRSITHPELRADSIAVRKETPGDRRVNHNFGHVILTELREGAARDQSYAHYLDVVRAHGDQIGKRLVPLGVAGVPWRAWNGDRPLKSCRRKGQRRGGARPSDARNRGQRALDAILKCDDIAHLREELGRAPHPNGKYAVRLEARICPKQPLEAAHDERAATQQNKRERYLRHNHAATPAALSAAATDRAAGQKRR